MTATIIELEYTAAVIRNLELAAIIRGMADDNGYLRDLMEDAAAKLRQLAFRWQPIASAPKDGTQILSALGGARLPFWWQQTTFWNTEGKWSGFPDGITPSHWMTLPEPPNGA